MLILFLLDVVPNPVNSDGGVAGLILIAGIVLMMTTAIVVGLMFLLKAMAQGRSLGLWSKIRRLRYNRLMVGDVCLSADAVPPKSRKIAQDNR